MVGEQPVLNPGQSFSYTSGCPLRTPRGVMQGHYSMVVLRPDGEWGEEFSVKVGDFGLDAEGEALV